MKSFSTITRRIRKNFVPTIFKQKMAGNGSFNKYLSVLKKLFGCARSTDHADQTDRNYDENETDSSLHFYCGVKGDVDYGFISLDAVESGPHFYEEISEDEHAKQRVLSKKPFYWEPRRRVPALVEPYQVIPIQTTRARSDVAESAPSGQFLHNHNHTQPVDPLHLDPRLSSAKLRALFAEFVREQLQKEEIPAGNCDTYGQSSAESGISIGSIRGGNDDQQLEYLAKFPANSKAYGNQAYRHYGEWNVDGYGREPVRLRKLSSVVLPMTRRKAERSSSRSTIVAHSGMKQRSSKVVFRSYDISDTVHV